MRAPHMPSYCRVRAIVTDTIARGVAMSSRALVVLTAWVAECALEL
jgi:hypothetical protein